MDQIMVKSGVDADQADDAFQRFDANKDAVIDKDEYPTVAQDLLCHLEPWRIAGVAASSWW